MRVALISFWSCPLERLGVLSSGGMNVYIFNLANELEKRNIHVDIFTRSHRERHGSVLYLSPKVCLVHLRVKNKDNYKGVSEFASGVRDFIKREKAKYDVLHSHYYFSALVGIILAESLNIPHVVSFHTLGGMKKKYAGIVDNKRIAAEKEIVKSADTVIASTVLEKNDLMGSLQTAGEKISVINPGVNHGVFKPVNRELARSKLKLSQTRKYILFVGRIDPVKGINLLLEAVCSLNSRRLDFKGKFRLLIIGGDVKSRSFWDSPHVRSIKEFIKKRNISGCTQFVGSVPHNKLPLYYSASDLVVLPSVYESFGLVVLEAMSCGACVLASRVGGLKFLVKDGVNGILFKNGDKKDLEEKMKTILDDNGKRKTLGKNAHAYSHNFSWKLQADKIITLYRKLITKKDV